MSRRGRLRNRECTELVYLRAVLLQAAPSSRRADPAGRSWSTYRTSACFVRHGGVIPGLTEGVKRDGRQTGGCRRQPVFGPRAGARAGVTVPGRGAGATAGRAAAANTRATQVQLLEASNTNGERQAYRNPAKTCEAPSPGLSSRWSHVIGGGDTLPASSHNVNGSKTTGERRVPLAARRLKCREFPGNNVETSSAAHCGSSRCCSWPARSPSAASSR